jgi:hypothetical protein
VTKFLLIILFVMGSAHAQKIEGTANVVPGDKLTYKFTFGGNSISFQNTITSVTADEIKGEIVILDRKIDFQAISMGVISKEMCASNGQSCSFKTPVKMYDSNTALNDKWENIITVMLDSFSVDLKSQHKADKFEKIKLQFNEFNALRISQSGTIQGKQNDKEFRGTESSKYWIGVVNGVQLMLRREYQNSFGDKTVIELTDAQLTGAK